VIGGRPSIEVVFPPNLPARAQDGVVVAVDETDVTTQVVRQPGRLTYRFASGLTPGPHTVTLTFPDPASGGDEPTRWTFPSGRIRPPGEANLNGRGWTRTRTHRGGKRQRVNKLPLSLVKGGE